MSFPLRFPEEACGHLLEAGLDGAVQLRLCAALVALAVHGVADMGIHPVDLRRLHRDRGRHTGQRHRQAVEPLAGRGAVRARGVQFLARQRLEHHAGHRVVHQAHGAVVTHARVPAMQHPVGPLDQRLEGHEIDKGHEHAGQPRVIVRQCPHRRLFMGHLREVEPHALDLVGRIPAHVRVEIPPELPRDEPVTVEAHRRGHGILGKFGIADQAKDRTRI